MFVFTYLDQIADKVREESAMSQRDSSYFLNADTMIEPARLINQDRRVTAAVSLLPPGIDGATLSRVLDIGCGPGGWLLDLLTAYPHIVGIGIDISESMLSAAQLLKKAEGIGQNLTFTSMDARKPLLFPDASFDFIHMRLTQSFLHAPMWESTLKECYRLLQQGTTLCITDLEMVLSQKPAAEEFSSLAPAVYSKMKLTFSPSGRSMGILPALRSLLPQIGFNNLRIQLYALDESYGEPYHDFAFEDQRIIYAGMRDFLKEHGGYSIEYLDRSYEAAAAEWNQPDFACISLLFSLVGKKPEKKKKS